MRALYPLFAIMLALVGGSGLLAMAYRAEVSTAQAEGREAPGFFGYVWSFVPMPEGGITALYMPDPPAPEADAPEAATPAETPAEAPVTEGTVVPTAADAAAPAEVIPPEVVVNRGIAGKKDAKAGLGAACRVESGRKICGDPVPEPATE